MLQPQHSPENLRHVSINHVSINKVANSMHTPNTAPTPAPPDSLTNVIPDTYRLTAQIEGTGYVASAMLGDLDVLHNEFSVRGSALGELHLTIRGDSATVKGQVTFQGQPAPDAQVYLIPTSGDAAGPKLGVGGMEGRFQIPGVPPGDYRIRAWTRSPPANQIL